MSTDENKAVVRRFFEEAWNHNNLSVAGETFSVDNIHHFGGSPGPLGPDQTQETAIPDYRAHIEDMVAEGDIVVTRLRFTGTHHSLSPGLDAYATAVFGHLEEGLCHNPKLKWLQIATSLGPALQPPRLNKWMLSTSAFWAGCRRRTAGRARATAREPMIRHPRTHQFMLAHADQQRSVQLVARRAEPEAG